MVVLWELEFSPKELPGISDNCFKKTKEAFTINGSSELQKDAVSVEIQLKKSLNFRLSVD